MPSPFPCSPVICGCFWKKITELSCTSIKFRSDVINMCVVPVQIRHPDFNKVLDTHAMLDIRYHWSRNKSNSEDINGDISRDDHCGWESEDSRIIGQTDVDKATKSIQQTGSTSWRARYSNTRKSAKKELSGRSRKWNFPKYWYLCGIIDWYQQSKSFETKRGDTQQRERCLCS